MIRIKIITICILIIILMIFSNTTASNLPLIGKTIYIDPGHGGIDPGTIYKEINEAEITLNFSNIIGNKLERLGAAILYTRIGNYDLASTTYNRKRSDLFNRVKLINDSNADMYISIHVNSSDSSKWYGPQIFYSDVNKKNENLANQVYKELNRDKLIYRKIKLISGLYMYDKINIPGILYEIGFLSNYSDRKKINDSEYLEEVSNSLIKGIINYLTV